MNHLKKGFHSFLLDFEMAAQWELPLEFVVPWNHHWVEELMLEAHMAVLLKAFWWTKSFEAILFAWHCMILAVQKALYVA